MIPVSRLSFFIKSERWWPWYTFQNDPAWCILDTCPPALFSRPCGFIISGSVVSSALFQNMHFLIFWNTAFHPSLQEYIIPIIFNISFRYSLLAEMPSWCYDFIIQWYSIFFSSWPAMFHFRLLLNLSSLNTDPFLFTDTATFAIPAISVSAVIVMHRHCPAAVFSHIRSSWNQKKGDGQTPFVLWKNPWFSITILKPDIPRRSGILPFWKRKACSSQKRRFRDHCTYREKTIIAFSGCICRVPLQPQILPAEKERRSP